VTDLDAERSNCVRRSPNRQSFTVGQTTAWRLETRKAPLHVSCRFSVFVQGGRIRLSRSMQRDRDRERQRRPSRIRDKTRTCGAPIFLALVAIRVAASPIYLPHCLTRIQATMARSVVAGIYHRRFSGRWKIAPHALETQVKRKRR